MSENDTIAAISTPYGTGGIGIIRISGEKAFEIASTIFIGKKAFSRIKSHSISYGRIIDPVSGSTVDEVLITKMERPATFTKEDVVEINCHGGIIVLRRILELVVRGGCRPAEPGEFTKRAFLNGRIDLSQAEAVIDLINSKTNEGAKAAVDQLEGRLSTRLKEARDKLIGLIAHIEVTVDYPEHDIEEITGRKVYDEVSLVRKRLSEIVKGFEKGRIIREGITTVIVGRPNVGKSSLLNELVGKSKAIVTDIPGTTRDIIEEYVNINGIPVRLVDTAGIRETEDTVEKLGVDKAEKALESAELVIMIIDAGDGAKDEDFKIIEKAKGKRLIILINKIDLVGEAALKKICDIFSDKCVIKASIKQNIGIDSLEEFITGLFGKGEMDLNSEVLVTNIRHKALIDSAINSIDDACKAYKGGMPLDFATIDIKNAAEYLGQITGESVSEDVVREIFSRFCIGK